MLKIRPLNRESSSDEDGPTIRREAQEEITLDMYNKALRLQSCGELLAAEDILQTLIEDNIPQLECQGGLPKTMSTIKYSCYTNLGSVALKKNDLRTALENYVLASELDKTDVTLWYKIGSIALKLDKFYQASSAFLKGLECSESHWPCLDQLISVSFALKDTITCLLYIGKALILDPDYIKGLVLRKNIYDCNPATKEYYQLYNPDFIYEPSLDITIITEDEVKYLDEAQKLCDRVNEVEKALGPKPLPCVPLPKPLGEYTWLSLGYTLTELHKYISENNMSHFCTVDLKKCMSDANKNAEAISQKDPFKSLDSNSNMNIKIPDKKEETKVVCDVEMVEKVSTEEIVEWRICQTSEHNTNNANEVENSTPGQTDYEETEQDVEDIDENVDQKAEKNKTQNRGTKRRRDLLSDLQIWGWHSKRKTAKKAKVEKDFTIEDALNRIIPAYLRPNGVNGSKYNPCEDSMNTMELYNFHVENDANSLMTPPHSPKHVEEGDYFGSQDEKDDVLKFWTRKWKCCDVVNLIEAYVYSLSALWSYRWPKELLYIYIDAYNMFREHCEHPHYHDKECSFEDFKNDALATLLYGELSSYNREIREQNKNNIHNTSLSYIQLVSAWDEQWGAEHASFWCRVQWLRAYVFRKDNQNMLAINALHLIQDVISVEEQKTNQTFKLHLPNCYKYGLVTSHIMEKLLKNLEMIESLSQLEKLYDGQQYQEVAEILIPTFNMSNPPTCGKMGRPAQLAMLLHSLWFTDIAKCFVWSETCLHESLAHFIKPTKDRTKWELVLDKCLGILHEIIKMETVTVLDSLSEENRVRLVESLATICCRQINVDNINKLPLGTVKPWILLHYTLTREEHRKQAKRIVRHVKRDEERTNKPEENLISEENIEEEIPPSIAILFSGHEFLGSKGWCLTEHGELLHFMLDTIIDRLDTPIFESIREKIDIHLEQAFFCLYQHPSKKNKISRHLADHNVNPIPLSWEKAQQVCEFFCPDALPEFDSYKNISISAELEQLLQRITSLVPSECDVQPLLQKFSDFVNGNSSILPKPISFPSKTRAMYYLLGDYYFKQSEVKRSYKYFLLDLCINPLRLDTWACLALGAASQLEQKLNHCERFKSETEFLDKAKSAQVCFKQALGLANNHITLWIEYGSFEYIVHSYCSRILKYESETLSMEKFDVLENKKENYLDSSGISFLKALELHKIDPCETDERWLYHYMLGKIAEKRQKEASEYLQHYLTAAALLNENKATYPDKISYTNPQHLALEALEVLYRINASILKYLELHEGKVIPDSVGKMFKQCLESCTFPKHGYENRSQTENKNESAMNKAVNNEMLMETDVKLEKEKGNKTIDANTVNVIDNRSELNKVDNENKIIVTESENKMKQAGDGNNKTGEEVTNSFKVETQNQNHSTDNHAEILPDVSRCIEDLLTQIENKPAEVEKNDDKCVDVIMIDDSDEEIKQDIQEKPTIDIKGKNVQEIMDAMMKETMDKQEDVPMDTDSDVTPQEVIIPPDDVDLKNQVEVKDDPDVDEKRQKIDNNTNDHKEIQVKYETQSIILKDIKSEKSDDGSNRKALEETSSGSSSSSESDSSDSDSDDSSSLSSSSSSDNNGNLTESEVLNLVDRCITGLEQCIRRLPQNYKALYRLAHVYYHYSKKKDLSKCRQLFLGEYKCKNSVLVSGLFADRKISNFFNGVWRIPSSEIDRPGSLAAHMGRCVSLLLQVLHDTNDHKTLLDLCLQLRRVPDADKIYIRHTEREQLSEQALSLCIQCLRKQIKNINNLSTSASQKFLLDIFRMYQKSQKNLTHKESVFSSMLIEVYKNCVGDKIPENSNFLDLAVKYCQQNRAAEKLKKQQQSQNLLPRVALITPTAPVLPPPSTVAPAPAQPLKRPSLGRPRGRPPGPKIPGQTRSPRSRNSVSSSNLLWNKSSYDVAAYDYLKHYQEELLRQYSQTLSLTQQMSQLSSFLPPSSQSNLLSPTSLLQTMQQLGSGINPLVANQLSQSINQLNPNLMKRINEMYKVPTSLPSTLQIPQVVTTEQLKQYSNLNQPVTSKNLLAAQMSSLIATQPKATTAPKSSSFPSYCKSNTGFKYPSAEFSKPKMKDITRTTSSYISKDPTIKSVRTNISQQEVEKTANILKDRPNISITPVSQPIIASPPKLPTSNPAKTLQEKLADKQKQHCSKNQPKTIDFGTNKPLENPYYTSITCNKPLDFGTKSIEKLPYSTITTSRSVDFGTKNVDKSTYPTISSSKIIDLGNKNKDKSSFAGVPSSSVFSASNFSALTIPSSLNVMPAFSKDSEISINKIGKSKSLKSTEQSFSSQPISSKSKSSSLNKTPALDLPPNIPMSLSVIRKPEEKLERKASSDDDVIIIE